MVRRACDGNLTLPVGKDGDQGRASLLQEVIFTLVFEGN